MKTDLPEVKVKKKINLKKFKNLAERVKRYFEEEYQLKREKNENRTSRKFSINY